MRVEKRKTPKLFVDFENVQIMNERRKYVEDEMVEMCRAGTLCLTDLMQQGLPLIDLIAQVIWGNAIVDGNSVSGLPVPREIENWRVTIECIPDRADTIKWKRGTRVADYVDWRGHGTSRRRTVMEDDIVDLECTRAEMNLKDAWQLMRRAGENCAPVRSVRRQESVWQYREVMKEKTPTDNTRGPGRPRVADARI